MEKQDCSMRVKTDSVPTEYKTESFQRLFKDTRVQLQETTAVAKHLNCSLGDLISVVELMRPHSPPGNTLLREDLASG